MSYVALRCVALPQKPFFLSLSLSLSLYNNAESFVGVYLLIFVSCCRNPLGWRWIRFDSIRCNSFLSLFRPYLYGRNNSTTEEVLRYGTDWLPVMLLLLITCVILNNYLLILCSSSLVFVLIIKTYKNRWNASRVPHNVYARRKF